MFSLRFMELSYLIVQSFEALLVDNFFSYVNYITAHFNIAGLP